MQKTNKCTRCGRQFKNTAYGKVVDTSIKPVSVMQFDLCYKCTNDFKIFMKSDSVVYKKPVSIHAPFDGRKEV